MVLGSDEQGEIRLLAHTRIPAERIRTHTGAHPQTPADTQRTGQRALASQGKSTQTSTQEGGQETTEAGGGADRDTRA